MNLTAKQVELLRVISGPEKDLDEILGEIRYETTKQSLQFSIRALIGHGLIEKKGVEKRRGRQRQVIGITALGAAYAGGAKPVADPNPVVSTVEDDQLEADLEILET